MAVGSFQPEESFESELTKFLQTTSVLKRKRVLPSQSPFSSDLSSPCDAVPLKRQNSGLQVEMRSNPLEALPQDVLVKILCKVNHSDLSRLLLVSKIFNQATLIARKLHFAFSTPVSRPVFKKQTGTDDEEAPNAPKQRRAAKSKSRLDGLNLSSITIQLFASVDDLDWPKNV